MKFLLFSPVNTGEFDMKFCWIGVSFGDLAIGIIVDFDWS